MLIVHILVALTSLIVAGLNAFFPSLKKLRLTYGLVFATLGTGTYLIVTTPSHMLTTCMEGLIYIGVVTTAIVYSTNKLSR
jgi:hypothetical protein